MGAHELLLFRARSIESCVCFGVVLRHSCDQAFYEVSAVLYELVTKAVFAKDR